jgi:superoxide reductase
MRRSAERAGRSAVVVGLAIALGLAAGPRGRAESGQEEQFTPEFKEMRSSYDAKHTPRIVAPDSVKRGQWFDVTVNVGAGGDHPSLSEHFVRYIALYKDTAEIARIYLHPVFSFPKVTFTIALDEGGSLRAVIEPTHSAAWEASKKIVVTP